MRKTPALLIALAVLAPAPAISQPSTEVPRTAWGKPVLGEVWDFRTITPLERPEKYGDREFLTAEEVAELEQGAADRDQERYNAPARRAEAGENVGAYNWFWMDVGTKVMGKRRTSLIIDPPNGRRPPRVEGTTGNG